MTVTVRKRATVLRLQMNDPSLTESAAFVCRHAQGICACSRQCDPFRLHVGQIGGIGFNRCMDAGGPRNLQIDTARLAVLQLQPGGFL